MTLQDAQTVRSGQVAEVEELLHLEAPDGRGHIPPSGSERHLALLVGDPVDAQLYLLNLPLPLRVC